jgi:hypothetical protein
MERDKHEASSAKNAIATTGRLGQALRDREMLSHPSIQTKKLQHQRPGSQPFSPDPTTYPCLLTLSADPRDNDRIKGDIMRTLISGGEWGLDLAQLNEGFSHVRAVGLNKAKRI